MASETGGVRIRKKDRRELLESWLVSVFSGTAEQEQVRHGGLCDFRQ
jgi:hypothetical protein